jgi:hypothetical protein
VACWATIGTAGVLYFLNEQSIPFSYLPIPLAMGGAVFGIMKATYCK